MKHIFTSLRPVIPVIAAMMLPAAALAVPAFPGVINVEQPDGSVIPVMVRGDHRAHMAFSTDGYALMRSADGFMVYATLGPDGSVIPSVVKANAPDVRSASERNFVASLNREALLQSLDQQNASLQAERRLAPSTRAGGESPRYLASGAAFPSKGTPRALVVLVEFQDVRFSMENPGDFYDRLLNEEKFSDYGATGSAADFYVENSNGVFHPHFDVLGPVLLENDMAHYGANDFSGYDVAPEQAVIEACQALDNTVDFSVYDTNGDGQIDNVFVFYAGYGEADSYQSNTIWPHSADLLELSYVKDKYYFDDLLLNRYGMTCELDFSYKRPDGIGTFVHEFSHVMGLLDLYATSYTSSFTPGPYSTLDMGPYNNEGRTPPHFSAFERYCLDWLEPDVLLYTGDYSLEPLHLSNKAYIINTPDPDEFFILENRQKECCDKYIPGHGMLVWHIDFDQKIWDRNVINNTPAHQYVDIIEADNRKTDSTRSGDPFPGTADVTSFNHLSNPALLTWSDDSLEVGLTDIKEEDGIISFHLTGLTQDSSVEVTEILRSCVSIDGNVISNKSDTEIRVFDVAGTLVATIAPGETAAPGQGIFIAISSSSTHKILLR